MENTKICSKCGRELPVSNFSKNKINSDGLHSWCKECNNQLKKQYYQTHREKILEQQKQYNAKYRQAHREEILERRKQYYQTHREHEVEYNKQYRVCHTEEIKQRNNERYATLEYYAYCIRQCNLKADRKNGRIGKDDDILPPLEYYIWALQQPDFYDGKHYHWSEMGLDRIYNDRPHTFANVVPCSTANNRRRHQMAFEEFCKLMRRDK